MTGRPPTDARAHLVARGPLEPMQDGEKPSRNGTVSGAADVLVAARLDRYATVVSARSGDTEDAWLADLAVAWRAGQIKVGSLTRSERTAKRNRLLEIERCHAGCEFAGAAALGS